MSALDVDMSRLATLLNVEIEGDKYPFKVLDSNPGLGLVLVHYDPDTIGKTKPNDPLRNLRGVIVDVSETDYFVVCPSIGYVQTATVTIEEFKKLNDVVDNNIVKDTDGHLLDPVALSYYSESIEGAMLRVWRHKDQLMISSYKKIDCSRSHWGGKYFVEMFHKYLDPQEIVVDASQVHFLIISDPDLMTLDGRNGGVYHICTYQLQDGKFKRETPVSPLKNCTRPFRTDNATTMNNYYVEKQSIIVEGQYGPVHIVTPDVRTKMELVGNDPSTLHRCYELSDFALFRNGEDKFLDQFPPVPIVHDRDVKNGVIRTVDDLKSKGVLYTREQLTDKKDSKVFERRLRTVLTHYAMTISSHFFAEVFSNISQVMEERRKLVKLLQINFDKFKTGDFSEFGNKRLSYAGSIGTYIKVRLENAEKFARQNCKDHTKLRGLIMHNIETGFLRDKGSNLYRMIAFLVRE